MHKELSFIIPPMLDSNFQKCQIFCPSKLLSDLVGNVQEPNIVISYLEFLLAAWISKELQKFQSSVIVMKLNGDNSHQEKERITHLFKNGYVKGKSRPKK